MKQGYPTLFSLQHVYPKYSEKAPILCQVLPPTLEASGKNRRFLRFPLSLNKIFLLSHWEFHIMHPGHIHFPVLPGSSPALVTFPQIKEEEKRSNLCHPYTHWNMIKFPVSRPLKKIESFPTLIPTRSHQL